MMLIRGEQGTGRTRRGNLRTCGLWLSVFDAGVLATGAIATAFAWRAVGVFALLIPFVIGHFFLFCNIFRVPRNLELTWAATFIVGAALWLSVAIVPLWLVISVQGLVTVSIIVLAMRRPSYHGVFSRRLNPHIDEYLRGT